MLLLVSGLIVFLGVHSIRMISPAWRAARIAAIGENAWKGVYTLLSFVGLALIVWGYGQARPEAAFLYEPPLALRHMALLLMLFSFISLMIFVLPAGRLKPLLKHPMLVAVKLWAFAHILANGDLASILLFGSFLVWAILNRISVKRRGGAPVQSGPAYWDAAAVLSGIAIYALFVWKVHAWLIGAAPLL